MESACSCVRASVANVVGQLQLTLPAARALFIRAFMTVLMRGEHRRRACKPR